MRKPRGTPAVLVFALTLVLPAAAAARQAPPKPAPAPVAKPVEDHAHHTAPPKEGAAATPKEPIPPVTDADRKAAFPPGLAGHAVHDQRFQYLVLFDRVEWQGGRSGGASIENTTWIGGDIDRLWLRTSLESEDGDLGSLGVHALWGHSVSRWWDVVAGVRQDFRPGAAQTWAAVGVQGLAPYWFEVEATAYVGAGGRTHARIEAEYDLLLTNRLVLQPTVELDAYGKSDPERGIGRGLSSLHAGFRLRYEIRRELAPYVGLTWDRRFFGTADRARAAGEQVAGGRLTLGVRTWF